MLDPLIHPCQGCQHRYHTPVEMDRRVGRERPTTGCRERTGTLYRVFWGDPMPTWCPGKECR